MTKPTLIYFDSPASRGEECRLAMSVAGVDFTDRRFKREEWGALKPTMPYGAVPVLEVPGKGSLAHSNAILEFIGRAHGLLPSDPFEAARHIGAMEACEELRNHTSPILRISDPEQKLAARAELQNKYFPTWAGHVEKQIGDGPFFGGSAISVADIKLYMITRWIVSGSIDHVSKDTLAPFAKLMRLYHAVADHPGIKAWQARNA